MVCFAEIGDIACKYEFKCVVWGNTESLLAVIVVDRNGVKSLEISKVIKDEGSQIATYPSFKLLAIVSFALVVFEREVFHRKQSHEARKLCQQAFSILN